MEAVLAAVMRRAEKFGLPINDAASAVNRAQSWLTADLGLDVVPAALHFVWEDMALGYLLREELATKNATSETPIKSISEGDVSVSFGAQEQELQELFAKLLRPPAALLAAYRRLLW